MEKNVLKKWEWPGDEVSTYNYGHIARRLSILPYGRKFSRGPIFMVFTGVLLTAKLKLEKCAPLYSI